MSTSSCLFINFCESLVESRLKIKFYKRGEKEYKGQHNSSLDNLEDYMPVKVYESYYP